MTGRDAAVTAFDRGTLRSRFGASHEEAITVFLARPFDLRFILYEEAFVARPRRALMSHLLRGDNIGLVVNRQCKGEPGALVTRWPVGHKVLCPHDVSSLFPLYLVVLPHWLRARSGRPLPGAGERERRRIVEALRLGLKVQSAIEEVLCD